MSRRHSAVKREILPDPRYGSVLIAKFINNLMRGGNKSVAQSIVYNAFDLVGKKSKKDIAELFEEVVNSVEPQIEVRSRRVGGATYQVPMEVRPSRARALAIRWILAAMNKRGERTATERLASEVFDILDGKGGSLKSRENTHKMAEANRAFSHYRW